MWANNAKQRMQLQEGSEVIKMDAFHKRVYQKIKELREQGEETAARKLEGHLKNIDALLGDALS